jgi:hypothetical protein
MAEKMFVFSKTISEATLWALLTAHSESTKIDIYEPQKRTYTPRVKNGHDGPQLLLEPPKKSKGEKQPKKTVVSAILQHMADHPKDVHTTPKLAEAIGQPGAAGAISVALNQHLKKGYIERVRKGEYKVLKEGIKKVASDFGQSPAPQKAKKEKQNGVGRGNYKRTGGANGRDLLAEQLLNGKEMTAVEGRELLQKHGGARNSAAGAFTFFSQKGYVTKVRKGVYQITEAGRAHFTEKGKAV